MRITKIIVLLLVALLLATLTACSKTKPDNNLERLWESLIAQERNTNEVSLAANNAIETVSSIEASV